MLVEAGKALGHLEQARTMDAILTQLHAQAQADVDKGVEGMPLIQAFGNHRQRLLTARDRIRSELPGYERLAQTGRDHAAELVAEAEHPGAALARRLVATVHGARAAWLGSR